MSVWRRKALELFPTLRQELQRRDYSIYLLYVDLLPMCFDAHDRGDDELLRRIYGFAAWCSEQNAKDLWNAAAVSFYEHLFDRKRLRRDVLRWLTQQQIEAYWPLWKLRLSEQELETLQELIAENRRPQIASPE